MYLDSSLTMGPHVGRVAAGCHSPAHSLKARLLQFASGQCQLPESQHPSSSNEHSGEAHLW